MDFLNRLTWRRNVFHYLRCGAKIATFLFWSSLYLMVMRLTVFKGNDSTPVVKDWSTPDNYTKWLLQGPVVGESYEEIDMSEETDNETLAELDQREYQVQQTCKMWGLPSDSINNKEFFVDHVHSLVWCNIFKAASSFWLYKFNILGGYTKKFLAKTRFNPLELARKKFPRPSPEDLRDAISNPGMLSLIVVRDPFVRLLSAYRDKLENLTPPFYRKMAKTIVAGHRSKAKKIFGKIKGTGPTFYEFVAYLIEKHKGDKLKGKVSFDEHWAPYYQFCTPCAVNFTVIAKVETLARDAAYVIRQLGLGHVFYSKSTERRMRLRTVMNKSKDGKNTTSLIKSYFQQLNEQMLDDLLDIYGIDFEMFGYNSNVYRSFIRK